MAFTKTAYEAHPVSPDRKRELNAQGYKIVDIRFAPQHLIAEPQQVAAPDLTPEAIASMEKPALVELLESSGVDFDKRLGAEKLRELAQQVAHSEPSADD